MSKLRFPGRPSKNAFNKIRVPGTRDSSNNESFINAGKIRDNCYIWQKLFEQESINKNFEGFTAKEAEESLDLALATAENNDFESQEHKKLGNAEDKIKSTNKKRPIKKHVDPKPEPNSIKRLCSGDYNQSTKSIILKPSTLKIESSFNSGYTLGSNWTTPTVKPTSLPDCKRCIICDKMTPHPDVQCDDCRSFMEKISAKTSQKFICLRGRGVCNITKCESITRCKACWLACCLSKLPVGNKTLARLKKFLPNSHQRHLGAGFSRLRGWSDNSFNQTSTQLAARALMKKATKTVNNSKHKVLFEESVKNKEPKRQKNQLKGPRIKHVCRSAHVVLGQPPATFPIISIREDVKIKPEKKSSKTIPKDPEIFPPEPLEIAVTSTPAVKTDIPAGWICVDFDDDPYASVITAIPVGDLPAALCLICGSIGTEPLLFCAMCCEPYHIYCLEETPALNKMWICERCELCAQCRHPTQHFADVLRCHKCAAPYHKQCATNVSVPWECPSCNVCRSCGLQAAYRVGNTNYCTNCYGLRKKGNYCPICQQCYRDDDFDTKMLECGECLSWIHATCDQISDEKYQLLSHLPESVEYICSICGNHGPTQWQTAIENEVKNGVANIMKTLAKYRSVKVTPHKVEKPEIVATEVKIDPKIETVKVKLDFSEKLTKPKATQTLKLKQICEAYKIKECSVHLRKLDSNSSNVPVSNIPAKSEDDNKEAVIEVDNNECKPVILPPVPVTPRKDMDVKEIDLILRQTNLGFYDSVVTFYNDCVKRIKSSELKEELSKLLTATFPWFKPGEFQETFHFNTGTKDDLGTEKQEETQLISQRYLPVFTDNRVCALCQEVGDKNNATGERLLHTGLAPPLEWVHACCALWSSEVWEDKEGYLHSLPRNGKNKCAFCGEKNATIGCCHSASCQNTYHWPCVLALLKPQNGKKIGLDPSNMSLYCTEHCYQNLPELKDENHEYDFSLPRKLRIPPTRSKKRYGDPTKVQVVVGSLRVDQLGIINSLFCHDETRDLLVPHCFRARRLFWSTKEPWKIVEYLIIAELEAEDVTEESISKDINMTVEHGSHGAPQEVLEKNLRVLRQIQQHESERDPDKENAEDLLLPPDLKETIFQDLNNELLDGISMQDIFTKLLPEDSIKEEDSDDEEEVEDVRECVDNMLEKVCHENNNEVKRIPQFDGADDSDDEVRHYDITGDSSSDGEKANQMKVEVETSLTRKIKERSLAASEPPGGPVRCRRCKLNYRTTTSLEKHLLTCTEMSSESSDESSESPTTHQRMTSKFGTVVVKTKLVLLPSPEKNKEKRSRRTVKLAAKPSSNNLQSEQITEPMIVGQSPIIVAPQPANTVYYINVTPSKQNYFLVNTGDSVMYMEPENPVVVQPTYIPVVSYNEQLFSTGHIINPQIQQVINTNSSQFINNSTGQIITTSNPPGTHFINNNQLMGTGQCQYISPATGQIIGNPNPNTAGCQYINPSTGQIISATPPAAGQFINPNTGQLINTNPNQMISPNNTQFLNPGHGQIFRTLPPSTPLIQTNSNQIISPGRMVNPNITSVNCQVPNQNAAGQILNSSPIMKQTTTAGQSMNPNQFINSNQVNRNVGHIMSPNNQNMNSSDINPCSNKASSLLQSQSLNASAGHMAQRITSSAGYPLQQSVSQNLNSSSMHFLRPNIPHHIHTNSCNVNQNFNIGAGHTLNPSAGHMMNENIMHVNKLSPQVNSHIVQMNSTCTVHSNQVNKSTNSIHSANCSMHKHIIKTETIQPKHQHTCQHSKSASFTVSTESEILSDVKPVKLFKPRNIPPKPRMPTVATATRFYIQPTLKTYSKMKPEEPKEANVVKISASVGTQTTLRCTTPSSIKKEIDECDDKTGIQFKILSSDGFASVANNVNQAWQNIFDAVQRARKSYNLSPLPYNEFSINGSHMSGLGQSAVRYLLEQLPGVTKCENYVPKFHNKKVRQKEPELNPTGCIRTEAFKGRSPYDMFGWLASAHRKPPPVKQVEIDQPSRRSSNSSLPMAMRFRQLKNNVKTKVGVFRSLIQGRGLFCLQELEQSEMVIEYAGEVIRSTLTDKREKMYESRGIGCYMFRIDDHIVVDATMRGNAARFINHSCEPNCYSRVVDVLGKKHILIFALRRILPGEELTYDYKFPFEDDKIPCTCGSRKCRKYLN